MNSFLYCRIFLISVLFSLLLAYVGAADSNSEQRTKILACLNLSRARLHFDEKTYVKLVEGYSKENQKPAIDKIVLISMVNCFNSISLIKAAELLPKKNYVEINALSPEHKALLNIENWEKVYDGKDRNKVETELKLMKEHLDKITKRGETVEDDTNYDQDVYLDEMEYQNLNLNVFKEMNPYLKNGLGLGFLGIIFFFLILGIRSLMKSPVEKKKKKNK